MFIQTEQTPNPNTLKFIPGVEVLGPGKTVDFQKAEEAKRAPLAEKLFSIEGVEGVFLGEDFISVTKNVETDWSVIKIEVLSTIMDYFVRYSTVEIKEDATQASSSQKEDASAVETEIIELLESRVRPAVAQDGGDILFDKFEDGVVYLKLQGACSGCPSSSATLKSGIENMLRYYIPEVQEVRAVA